MAEISNNSSGAGQKAANILERAMGRYNSPFGSVTSTQDTVRGKYEVGQMTYPTDLFSPTAEYGGNYAIFYVNVAEDSKLITQGGEAVVDIGANERLRASVNQAGLSSAAIIAGSTILGAASGTILGALGGGGGSVAGGGVTGGILGAAAAGIVTAAAGGKMSRQQKRLKAAIALNIPNQLNIRYSVQYQEADTGAFQAAAMIGEGGMNALQNIGSNAQSAGPTVTGTAGSVATALALNAPGGVGDGLSAAAGLTANPKKEQLFKGVDFRTFVFDYQFAPRDSTEARNVLNIIKMFKLHMHPEFKDQASFIFIYPSEFDIHYFYQGSHNKAIHKHTSCVLTDMNINYTPNGTFNTFADGTPTQINVQMTFKELAILTKDQIQQGF
jgi:hypothetical protein